MESVAFHGARRVRDGRERASFSQKFSILCFFSSVASRTCDLEAKQNKKKLIICKCPNSVRSESIVEKEEKLIN